eukprot:scaffold58_cov376-Prasinococcus_capsulatus_cf.AAC.1
MWACVPLSASQRRTKVRQVSPARPSAASTRREGRKRAHHPGREAKQAPRCTAARNSRLPAPRPTLSPPPRDRSLAPRRAPPRRLVHPERTGRPPHATNR